MCYCVPNIACILSYLIPPLGVGLRDGCGIQLAVCTILTILGYFPGVIYAACLVGCDCRSCGWGSSSYLAIEPNSAEEQSSPLVFMEVMQGTATGPPKKWYFRIWDIFSSAIIAYALFVVWQLALDWSHDFDSNLEVYIVHMDQFWGPVNMLVPSDCDDMHTLLRKEHSDRALDLKHGGVETTRATASLDHVSKKDMKRRHLAFTQKLRGHGSGSDPSSAGSGQKANDSETTADTSKPEKTPSARKTATGTDYHSVELTQTPERSLNSKHSNRFRTKVADLARLLYKGTTEKIERCGLTIEVPRPSILEHYFAATYTAVPEFSVSLLHASRAFFLMLFTFTMLAGVWHKVKWAVKGETDPFDAWVTQTMDWGIGMLTDYLFGPGTTSWMATKLFGPGARAAYGQYISFTEQMTLCQLFITYFVKDHFIMNYLPTRLFLILYGLFVVPVGFLKLLQILLHTGILPAEKVQECQAAVFSYGLAHADTLICLAACSFHIAHVALGLVILFCFYLVMPLLLWSVCNLQFLVSTHFLGALSENVYFDVKFVGVSDLAQTTSKTLWGFNIVDYAITFAEGLLSD